MQKQDFKKLFEHGPVILDGATGSNLMKAGMPKAYVPKNGFWNIRIRSSSFREPMQKQDLRSSMLLLSLQTASLWQITVFLIR